ncbi:hypothetical protein ACFQGT_20395 [Natrialbaceae archaeon GCM10025810]|uniref:DUF7544 domain-containing protein n=1 Tax=Halovalidus salilacus TaxID=3075124 RepID=UPI00360C9473
MSWRALDELRPSLEATRGLLLPFELRRWLVLAVVAFFVSGVSGGRPDASTTAWDAPRNGQPVDETPIPIDDPPLSPEIDVGLIAFAVGTILVIGLVLLLVGAIMEFVFVRILTDREVRIRGYFSTNVSNGASLFLFRAALLLGVLALIAFPAVLFFFISPLLLVPLAILLVPVLLVTGIALWVVLRFTADFVVPVMLLEGAGIVEAWREFWPALVEDWEQYGVYALARLVLGFVAGILVGIGFVAVGIVLAIPFGIVGVTVYFLLEVVLGLPSLSIVLLVAVGILYAISVIVAGITLVQVPIQTYLRYYSLFVLGGITSRFDTVGPLRPREADRFEDEGSSKGV